MQIPSVVNPPEKKSYTPSREALSRIFLFALFGALGFYGSFLLFLELPVALFVGCVLGSDRVRDQIVGSYPIGYWQAVLWAAIGGTAGGSLMWMATATSFFRPALWPLVLSSPGLCLVAGVAAARTVCIARSIVQDTPVTL